jgi:hypothetical protein
MLCGGWDRAGVHGSQVPTWKIITGAREPVKYSLKDGVWDTNTGDSFQEDK